MNSACSGLEKDCVGPDEKTQVRCHKRRPSAPSGPPLMAGADPDRPRGPPSGLILLLSFLFLPWVGPVYASELISSFNESGICKSVDIRNSLKSLNQLDGCQVIEGSLQILLLDHGNETELAEMSFPDLVEITDYLLLFRVNGLRSIGQLFPNLTVIRGQNLFAGFKALIIFEMSSLQEIGLHSLTNIMRGVVHIDKNPSLCFVHTIDWNKIVHDKTTPSYLKSLKPENECPVCPRAVNGKDCPRSEKDSNKFLCWNRDHCQKMCNGCGNRTCNDAGDCCDKHCVGGCGMNTTKCTLCLDYALTISSHEPIKCVEKCPEPFYSFLGRRCVSKSECINMTRPVELPDQDNRISSDIEHPYKIFNGSCILECPANYADNYTDHSCRKCDNTCRKECPGARIDSINLAQQLKGCTHITSSLEIQIRGGDKVVKELTENLGMIEEIEGYLKVVRSFSLVSLNFFQKLKRIRGKYLESQKYSFVVLDNQNLQDLFDWKTHEDFKIDNGSLFFHFNPKLCINKIEKLGEVAKLPPFTEMEVASNSNGDKVACTVTELKVNISNVNSKAAALDWFPFHIEDSRKLLSYTVYSIEAPNKNVNFYDGRDACGQDNWHVDDVASNSESPTVTHLLTNLKPFTQYAFYVKTYTIATERNGAQSTIRYFTTKPAQPSLPRQLYVISNSSDSLTVKWAPPAEPNGVISHYIVSGIKHGSNTENNRDYCKDIVSTTVPRPKPQITPATQKPAKDTCANNKNKPDALLYDEQEEISRINFENELHNKVYVKRTDILRTRRAAEVLIDKNTLNGSSHTKTGIPDTFPEGDKRNNNITETQTKNRTEPGTKIWESFSFPVYGAESFHIQNLHHYTTYDISVRACRETVKDDGDPSCSETQNELAVTSKKEGADNITNVKVLNITSDSVTVKWTLPSDPNGMIVSVTILYKREGSKNTQYIRECISFQDFKKYSTDNLTMVYTISKLSSGNHSLCLKASSFAGFSDISECVNFVIPEKTSNAVLVTVLVLLVVFIFIMGGVWWFYKKSMKERDMRLIPSVNPEYVASIYVPDEWEVARKKIEFIKELGQGSFGMVWEGLAYDIRGKTSVRCAVKTVNEHATNRERIDFLNEASVMKAFDTTHVVRLLGVVSQGQPTLVIMELMAQGDLKTYLRSHRPENNDGKPSPTLKQILQMAIEIADGMAYLEAKKFVHRDLAARNCMVAEDLTVKIGDFGMTRDIYETDYYRKGSKGLLPVRWMAPESLKDGVFSSSSDVWSYGVVLWEMATLASQPYQGLANDQVLRYVIDGGVMERPENCPDKLYELMRHCWDSKPGRRPTFMKLCQLLLADANETFAKVSFYHSSAGIEARAARAAALANTENGDIEGDGDEPDASTPLNALPPDVRIVSGYAMSTSEKSDSIQSVHIDPNPRFYSMSEDQTANGYVRSGRARNGTTQSQC